MDRRQSAPSFTAAWNAEIAEVPAYLRLHDPHRRWPAAADLEAAAQRVDRVYRLQTDDGERIIGRRVSPAWVANADDDRNDEPVRRPCLCAALIEGKTILDLAEGLQLRRVRVMGADRIELSGFTDAMRERLRAFGLFSEIISWKLRFFVPVGADGATIIGKLIGTYPIQRVGEREAA